MTDKSKKKRDASDSAPPELDDIVRTILNAPPPDHGKGKGKKPDKGETHDDD
jgi:hypothetical protein